MLWTLCQSLQKIDRFQCISPGSELQFSVWKLKVLVWEKPAFFFIAEALPALLRLGKAIEDLLPTSLKTRSQQSLPFLSIQTSTFLPVLCFCSVRETSRNYQCSGEVKGTSLHTALS